MSDEELMSVVRTIGGWWRLMLFVLGQGVSWAI